MPALDRTQQIIELTGIVQELVETLRDQTKDLERLVVWLEQQTSLRDDLSELSVEVSRLNTLLHRLGALRAELQGEPPGE